MKKIRDGFSFDNWEEVVSFFKDNPEIEILFFPENKIWEDLCIINYNQEDGKVYQIYKSREPNVVTGGWKSMLTDGITSLSFDGYEDMLFPKNKDKKIAVIGAGKWGSAIYHSISIENHCLITNRTKKNMKNFVSLEEALKCDLLIISISSQIIKDWLKENYIYRKGQKVLVASKGIDTKTNKFLSEIYEEYIPKKNLGFLSGPSFASEVIKDLPTAVVINSKSKKFYDEFSPLFSKNIKTYYSKDVIGAEVAGSYKNVLAIASGICEGLKLGNNARASLLSRGLVEMERFGKVFGAKRSTFTGLSGAGDLFLTASSEMSRNFRVGLGLAKNKSIEEILKELGEVAEGIETTKAINNLSEKYNIYTPIAYEMKLILEGKKPKDSLKDIMK